MSPRVKLMWAAYIESPFILSIYITSSRERKGGSTTIEERSESPKI